MSAPYAEYDETFVTHPQQAVAIEIETETEAGNEKEAS